MIEGIVTADYEAVITLSLQGPAGQVRTVDAVIDTGFNSFLTLPPTLVTELDLLVVGNTRATLADGSEEVFEVREVTVLWDGLPRHVDTYVTDAPPLVGMLLLDSYSLYVEVVSGGRVVIRAIG